MSKIYGIDLGTTNSLIGYYKDGFLSEMVPSCVAKDFKSAGAKYFDDPTCTRSYKVNMSLGKEGIIPIMASTAVLRELTNHVKDDKVKDVVISVPAFFSEVQRTATKNAAEQAGLNVRALVNEPTAAAIYISKNEKGLYVVFDLGGGTFDVSIIDSRFGNYDIQATDGCILGGDNLDRNLAKYFIKEYKLPAISYTREQQLALYHYCSKIKIQMQKSKAPLEVDLSMWKGKKVVLTPELYNRIVRNTFAPAIDKTKQLINTYIPEGESYSILLVGGSTHCPYLQDFVTEALGQRPEPLTYNPDYVVAQGAAMYASLIEDGKLSVMVSDVTKALSIGLADGTVSNIVEANSHIPLSVSKMFWNPIKTSALTVDLFQGDQLLQANNEHLGQLIYDYGREVEPNEGAVEVTVQIDSSGLITLSAGEILTTPVSIQLRRGR